MFRNDMWFGCGGVTSCTILSRDGCSHFHPSSLLYLRYLSLMYLCITMYWLHWICISLSLFFFFKSRSVLHYACVVERIDCMFENQTFDKDALVSWDAGWTTPCDTLGAASAYSKRYVRECRTSFVLFSFFKGGRGCFKRMYVSG